MTIEYETRVGRTRCSTGGLHIQYIYKTEEAQITISRAPWQHYLSQLTRLILLFFFSFMYSRQTVQQNHKVTEVA